VRKKKILILAVCMVVLVIASLFVWNVLSQYSPPKCERNISRNLNNQEEESALTAAESINYSAIVSQERFDGSSDPQAYLNPGTYLAYTSANFIDSEAINYYQTRYDVLQDKAGPNYPKGIELTYEANVTKWSELRIYNSPPPENVKWHNSTIVMSTPNGTIQFNSSHMKFFYQNQSGYQMVEWAYDFSFSDCYVVQMKLAYSEYYAPLAAFFSKVYQIVVLDRNLEPVLVGVESGMAVA